MRALCDASEPLYRNMMQPTDFLHTSCNENSPYLFEHFCLLLCQSWDKKSLKQIITSSKKKKKNTSVTFDCMKESCLLLTAAAGYKTNVTVDSTHPRTCGQKSAQGDTDREVSLMISGTDICPFSPQSNFFV